MSPEEGRITRGPSGLASLSAAEAEALDRACDRFEAEWRAGKRPKIDDHLEGYVEPLRSALLDDLIAVELHWRRRHGERPDPTEYRERFPGRAPRVEPSETVADAEPTSCPTSLTPESDGDFSLTEELTGFLAPPLGPGEIGRLGPYRIVKLLGAGGMGAVFQAVDEQLGRSIAIKTMRPGLAASPQARKRFLREARAAAALSHDHVVTIYHVGEEQGVPFLVMPFLHGAALDERLRQDDRPSAREILRIMRETAEGLAAAHERGLVHRDVKPANIWLEAPRGRVKILDFGLASSAEGTDARLTQSGTILGTPSYMAPEQAAGDPVDQRADLYSLGAVAYRMATGRAPFEGKSVATILAAVMHDDPVPLETFAPELPPALAAVILRLLSKDPAARLASAREVVEAVEAIERGSVSPAAPAQPPEPTPHPARRSPRRWAVALLALAVLGGGGLGLFQVVVRFKHKDGTETRIELPPGTRVEVEDAGKVVSAPKSASAPKDAPREADTWSPGVPERRLPGLLPRQLYLAGLPGLGRWQIESIAPRAVAHGLAWSTRGAIAIGDHSGTIRVYDPAKLALKGLIPHGAIIHAVAWNPTGTDLAVASDDPLVRIWKTDGSATELKGHDRAVHTVAWTPDGERLATAGEDGTVRIWRADGTPGPVLKGHDGAVHTVAWSADGQRLASGGDDRTVRLWQADGTPGPVLKRHEGAVRAVAWNPKDGRLASAGDDKDVRLGQADDPSGPMLKGHNAPVLSLAWNPDGTQLLSGSTDGSARTWSAEGKAGRILAAENAVYQAAWSPDGRRIAAVGNGQFLQLWDADGTHPVALRGLEGYRSTITWDADGIRLAFTRGFSAPPGPCLATLAADGRPGPVLRGPDGGAVTRAAWSSEGSRLAAFGALDGGPPRLALVQADGQTILPLPGSEGDPGTPAWTPDGSRIAAAYWNTKDVRIWKADGTALPALTTGIPMISATWSPDGSRLAAGGDDGKIHTWKSDGAAGPVLKGHAAAVTALAWRPQGDILASCGESIRFWERGEQPGKAIAVGGQVLSLSWEPGGARLASGDGHGTVRLWSPAGDPLGVLKHHDRPVYSVAWSPRGDKIASLDGAATVVLCDAKTGTPLWTAVALSGDREAVFGPAGELLYGDPAAVDRELVFTVEDDRGRLELLTRTAFLKRAEAARAAQALAPAAEAVDSAAERSAAESLLRHIARFGGAFDVADARGKPLASFGKGSSSKLPDVPFVVDRVRLSSTSLTDAALQHLAGCRRIREAELSGNRGVTSRGLVALRGCRTLRNLNLASTGVGDGIGELLTSWPEMEQLSLLDCAVTDAAAWAWPELPRLRNLHAGATSITDEGLARIVARCPNIDEIHIDIAPTGGRPPAVATLKPLRRLRYVAFLANQLSDDGLTVLADLPHLEEVWIGSPATDDDLSRLARLGAKITVLYVYDIKSPNGELTDDGFAAIARMHGLRKLYLMLSRLGPSDEILARFAELPRLELLSLDFVQPGKPVGGMPRPERGVRSLIMSDPAELSGRRHTADGIAAFRKRRPDVALQVDCKFEPPLASPPAGQPGTSPP